MSDFSNSKLAGLYGILKQGEGKQFVQWLASPLMNPNRKLQKLHEQLWKNRSRFTQLAKEEIHQKAFPDQTYKSGTFSNLMSSLTQKLEQFLVHQQLAQRSDLQQQLLKEVLLDRQKIEASFKINQQLIDQLNEQHLPSRQTYLQLQQLNEQHYFQAHNNNRFKEYYTYLVQANKNLDAFYALSKLRYLSEFYSRKKQLQSAKQALPKYQHLKPLKAELRLPAADLLYELVEQKTQLTPDDFWSFKNRLLKSLPIMAREDQSLLLHYTINMAVHLINKGELDIYTDLFELYQLGLKRQLILHESAMTDISFTNLVILASSLYKTDFVKDFIKNYLPRLPNKSQHDAQIWSKAQYLYIQGELEACNQLLQTHKFQHFPYTFISRVTYIKNQFDQLLQQADLYPTFRNTTEAFDKYMQRNKEFPEDRTQPYIQFCRLCQQLARMAVHDRFVTDATKEKLKEKIRKKQGLTAKLWLISKLDIL